MEVQEIREALSRQRGNIKTRYRVQIPQNDVYELLSESYRTEVAKRGMVFFGEEKTSQIIEKVSKWLTGNYKPGLILYGGVGSGKTTIMKAVAEIIRLLHYSALKSEQKSLKIISAIDLVKMAQENPKGFEDLKRCEMLAIDDLGIEPDTIKQWGNESAPVIEMLYYRYDYRMFTIITTNLDDKGLKERYDLRVADRMREMFDTIACTSESFRK